MKKPLHIQFLESFELVGIGRPIDVSDFITKNFTLKKGRIDYNFPPLPSFPVNFLDDLIQREVIISEDGDTGVWVFEVENDSFVPRWVSDRNVEINKVYFYMTSKGLDYLDEYRIRRTTKWANISIIVTLVITTIFSVSTFTTSLWNYNLSKRNFDLSRSSAVSDSLSSINVSKRLDTLTLLLHSMQLSSKNPIKSKTSPKPPSPK